LKKIVSILLTAILAVTLCISMSATAFAEGKVTITASVSPSSLTGAGTVSVKVTVQNDTDSEINDVTVIFPGDDSENIGSISAGDAGTRSDNEWYVSEDMLDTDLTFSATFTDVNGNSQTVKTKSLTIAKKESTVAATATASVSKDTIEKGEKVKFTFKLKNEGNVTLEEASLKAPPLSDGDQLGKTFSLEPGETKIMTWETPLNESIDVKPVFSYTADGEKGTAKAGTVSVTIDGEAQASATPEADSLEVVATANNTQVKAGEQVSFEVTVRNHGSEDLKNLKVTDADGNKVTFTGTQLEAGSAAKGTLEVALQETTNFVFTATAEDADGNSVKAASDPVEITVDTIDLTSALTMDVAFIPEVSKAGPVDFTFKVKNSTGQEIKNIVISEATLGQIAAIPSMTEAEQDITQSIQVDQTTSFVFTISGELPDGTKLESQTQQPATVTVKQAFGGMSTMLILLLIVVIAIAVVAITLGVFIHKNKKAGYTAFGKRRDGGPSPQQRPRQGNGGNRPGAQQHYQERPPQVRQQQQRSRAQMPREEIEPRQQRPQAPRQKQQRPPVPKKGGKGYSDRNKF